LVEGGGTEAAPEVSVDHAGDAVVDRSVSMEGAVESGTGAGGSPARDGMADGSGGGTGGGTGGTDGSIMEGGTESGDALNRDAAGGATNDAPPDRSPPVEAGEAEAAVPDARIDAGADSSDQSPVRDAGPDIAPEPTIEAAPDVREASVVDQSADRSDGGASAQSFLAIVAHPDDEIIFMNPDLEGFTRTAGATSTIVYLTSGDQSENRGWPDRELGVLDAASAIAGLRSSNCLNAQSDPTQCRWSCAPATFAGKPVSRCTSSDGPLTSIFLRILDESVGPLWNGPIPLDVMHPAITMTMQVADAGTSATYVKQDLIDVLTAIMNTVQPTQILTMDSTLAYNGNGGNNTFDHPDHMGAGFFALAAAQAYHGYQAIHVYRGYTVQGAASNVSTNDKQSFMLIYANQGSPNCNEAPYNTWCDRQYVYVSQAPSGRIQSSGMCMDRGGVGNPVSLNTCSAAATQQWTLRADATLVTNANQCLTAGAPGQTPTVENCTGALTQRWTWLGAPNGQLRGNDGSCLDSNGGAIVTTDCGSTNADVIPTQAWTPN